VLAELAIGSVAVSPGAVASALFGEGPPEIVTIVRELRLPRALWDSRGRGAGSPGASLQALLPNPLADPYLLGVSGGAACGTLVATLLSPDAPGGLLLPVASFLGALAGVSLVGLAATSPQGFDRGRLLLSGVVVNAFASAILLFLLSFGDPGRTRGFVFWMLGSLSGATLSGVKALAVWVAVGALALLPLHAPGSAERQQPPLSIPSSASKSSRSSRPRSSPRPSRMQGSSLRRLLGPQTLRLVVRSHRSLLLASFLLGAGLLCFSDVLARRLFAPQEISIGAVTALLGAPVFLFLLRRTS
jgi:iron complex transport system permease protein